MRITGSEAWGTTPLSHCYILSGIVGIAKSLILASGPFLFFLTEGELYVVHTAIKDTRFLL